MQGLPLLVVSGLFLFYAAAYWRKRFLLGRTSTLHSHASKIIGLIIVMFYFLYLFLTRSILDVFNCTPTDPYDGYTYLEVVFEKCWVDGGIHMKLLPYAALATILYTLGYPILMASILFAHRDAIYADQILLAQFTGHKRKDNPLYYDVRKRYSKLYYQFK